MILARGVQKFGACGETGCLEVGSNVPQIETFWNDNGMDGDVAAGEAVIDLKGVRRTIEAMVTTL